MHSATACEALQKNVCLEIRYDGYTRDVEVHAVGVSSAGHSVMRVWQVRGGSVHNEPVGWKMLRLDEAVGVALLVERSQAPRSGYKRNDRGMQRIIAQI